MYFASDIYAKKSVPICVKITFEAEEFIDGSYIHTDQVTSHAAFTTNLNHLHVVTI